MQTPPQNAERSFPLGMVLRAIIFFFAYLGCEYFGKAFSFPEPFSPSLSLSTGLLFGVLIVFERKDWLFFLVPGLIASCLFSAFGDHKPVSLGAIVFVTHFLQGFLGLFLLRLTSESEFTFRKVRQVVDFIIIALPIAIFGGGFETAAYSRFYPNLSIFPAWPVFALADLAAFLSVTPLVVKILRTDPSAGKSLSLRRIIEGSLLVGVLLIICDCIFGPLIRAVYPGLAAKVYQVFPILLWAAIRFGPRGASLVSFIVAFAAVLGTSTRECSIFESESVLMRALLLDTFLITSASFAMISAALMAERLRSASQFSSLVKQLEGVNEEFKLEIVERRNAERMLRAILDGANSSIISTDVNGTILTFNKAAQNLLGYSAEEVIGNMNLLQIHDESEIQHRAEVLTQRLGRPVAVDFQVLVSACEKEVEWTYLAKGDARADVVVFMTALLDRGKNPIGYLAVGRDITLQKQAEAALAETRSAVHNFFENGPLMMGVVEIMEGDQDILHISDNIASAEFYGRTSEQMSNALATELGDTPEHISFWIAQFRRSEQTGKPVKFEYELQVGGALTHLRATVSFIALTTAGRSRFSYIMEDITAYRETQAQLKRFAAILEATTDFVAMADRTGRTLYLNRAAYRLLGLPEGEGVPPDHLIFKVHPAWASILARREGIPVAMLEGVWQGESALLGQDQKEIPVSQVILSHRSASGGVDFISTIMRDVTEQKLAEERIRTSLNEKEALLKEIHHRVKNNMQVVSSLLQLQSGYTQDPEAKAMFEESRDRIRSMALIHEKLYQTKDLAKIDFNEYIPSLVNMIFATQNVRTGEIRARINVGTISFGVDTAIPLGLIINELVSNSLKHAFKDRSSGVVSIELQNADNHGYSLTVCDDGAGLPPGFNIDATSSLGLRLVRILTQQIGGELKVANQNGSLFQINFNETTNA